MGYYTRFKIKSATMADCCDPSDSSKFIDELCKVLDINPRQRTAAGLNNWDSMKWYEHEADVSKAMIASGADRVVLHGEGEEQGDVWDKTFTLVDGKVTIKTTKYKLVAVEES